MKASMTPEPRPTPSWELVQPSLQLVREHFDQVIVLFVLPALLLALGSLLLGETSQLHHASGLSGRQMAEHWRLGSRCYLVTGELRAVAVLPFLQIAQAEAAGAGRLLSAGLTVFLAGLAGLNLLLAVIVLVGFVLIIVPGIILPLILFTSRYYLANYYLMDRDLTIKEALRQSHHETKPVVGSIWGIIGVQLVFSAVAGLLNASFRLGVLVSVFIPLVCLYLPALRYREITRFSKTS